MPHQCVAWALTTLVSASNWPLPAAAPSAVVHSAAFCALQTPACRTISVDRSGAEASRFPSRTATTMCARPEKMETPTLSALIRVAELAKEDRQAAMAVAGIRGLAFAGPSALSSEEFIDKRFANFQAIRERSGKGATCMTALLPVPPPEGLEGDLAGRLMRAPELQTQNDREFAQALASIEKKRESGALDAAAAARAIREAATSWGAAPRSVVVAAIDLSTHEFALVAPAWEAAFGARCGYLSELAVHPAFQRLGLGAMLFNAAVVAARARDFSDIFLHVEERNTGARAIYEAEGFVLVPPCKAQEEFDAALVLDQGPKQVLYRLSV